MGVDHGAHVLAGRRRSGRTEALLRWLHNGIQIPVYPLWSRVVVVPIGDVEVIRRRMGMLAGSGPWLGCILTPDQLRDAFRGKVRPGAVEIAVDDADILIADALGVPQFPELICLHGAAVDVLDAARIPPRHTEIKVPQKAGPRPRFL